MAKQELLTLSAFATRCGVSQPAISKAVRGPLLSIRVGRLVDAAHPSAVAYQKKRKGAPTPVAGKKTKSSKGKKAAGAGPAKKVNGSNKISVKGSGVKIPEDLQTVIDLTLRELVRKHGTNTAFSAWIGNVKTLEDISKTQLSNAKAEGLLVSRDLVKRGVLDPINAAHVKMMTDGAKTITRRVTAMHDGGTPLEDIESFVREQIASFIKPVKAKVRRTLKNG